MIAKQIVEQTFKLLVTNLYLEQTIYFPVCLFVQNQFFWYVAARVFNSLSPGKFKWNFVHVIFKQILVIDGWGISCEIALIHVCMSPDFIDDQSTLVQVMAWCRQATSHCLSQCWPRSLWPCGVTRPQWVNSLCPSDAIYIYIPYKFGSILDQVMICCLTAPSHYLKQCWLVIRGVMWYSPESNFTRSAHALNLYHVWGDYY